MTKAEYKSALQSYLDRVYGSGHYTVGDGVESVCPATDLETDQLDAFHVASSLTSQSMFAGSIVLTCATTSVPAEVDIILNPLMTQAGDDYPEVTTAKAVVNVQRSVILQDLIFSYLFGEHYSGVFTGYRFEVVTTYSLNQDGRLALDEDGLPYDAV